MVDNYTGYTTLILDDNQLASFYQNKEYANWLTEEILENQYVLINNNGKVVDKYVKKNGDLRNFGFQVVGNEYTGKIKPRNLEQELAVNMLKDDSITVKLITGSWGTGKTLLLVTTALEYVQKGKFDKIYWIRNNVQVKDTDPLGALPGDALDKMLPYLMPFADHCGGTDGVKELIEHNQLEVVPLGFLRGRSIRNSIIISSEAENLTKEHIQLLLGRVDEGSNLWMDADLRQRDKISFEKSQGLETMVNKLKGNRLFGYVHLIKTERSQTAQLADLLND